MLAQIHFIKTFHYVVNDKKAFKNCLCVYIYIYIYHSSNLAIITLIDYLPTHGNQKHITTTS